MNPVVDVIKIGIQRGGDCVVCAAVAPTCMPPTRVVIPRVGWAALHKKKVPGIAG